MLNNYTTTKEKAKADFVSLTVDMCSSINIDGYLGETYHKTPGAKRWQPRSQ